MLTTAAANRQPNGVAPNSASPSPIIHFASGGCTTYAAHWSAWSAAHCFQMSALPSSSCLSASSTGVRSTPNSISESASLA